MGKAIKVIKKTKLTESADGMKELDKALKLHAEYIDYLKKMIEQEEDALKRCDNEEVCAAIQRRLDAFNSDLEAALPDAIKDKATEVTAEEEIAVEEVPTEEVATEETVETPEVTETKEATEEAKESLKESLEKEDDDDDLTEALKECNSKLKECDQKLTEERDDIIARIERGLASLCDTKSPRSIEVEDEIFEEAVDFDKDVIDTEVEVKDYKKESPYYNPDFDDYFFVDYKDTDEYINEDIDPLDTDWTDTEVEIKEPSEFGTTDYSFDEDKELTDEDDEALFKNPDLTHKPDPDIVAKMPAELDNIL